jgi:hypothetical protein
LPGKNDTSGCHSFRNAGPAGFGSLLVVEKGRPFFRLSVQSETRYTADVAEMIGAKIAVQVVDGSKLKAGDKARAMQELRDHPWFPSMGFRGTQETERRPGPAGNGD